ncbi:UNVERIFIED_CONTAM: Centrin-2, partial [Eudyptes robustus]
KPVLTKDEVEKAFDICDKDGTGFISIKRLKIVMRAMGFEPRQKEIDELVKKMQENEVARQVSSDSFTLEELMYILNEKLSDADDSSREIRSAFELFDVQNKGFINFTDLKRVAKELGEDEIEDKDLWEMIHFADLTKRGKVFENDFKVIMKKTKMY